MTDSSSTLSAADAKRIGGLAHLQLDDARVTETTAGLRAILDFGQRLQAIDTDGVEPTSQVTGLVDVLREDIVRPSDVSPETLLEAAPSREGLYFKVKRVMK